ncbi:MAG: serine/threonine protein kinase, partial [Planctomycetes bacterium]|nr:serine/threonine protein kinase [Planctomycetota bacterium]
MGEPAPPTPPAAATVAAAAADSGSAATLAYDGVARSDLRHSPDSAAPRVLGAYRLLRELGRGAMGVVYLAEERDLHRLVALKVLPPGVAQDAIALERFRREAGACAHLAHPHVVGVLGMGESDGVHYYAMEYVEGRPLSDLLARERLPPERAARIALQAARGLGHAHERGIVHRDIKPANLLLTWRPVAAPTGDLSRREQAALAAAGASWRAGEAPGGARAPLEDFVKLADFGLARVEGAQTLTATGHVMGTPAYMSPEQARGARADIGPAGDVYSLGATLYEMLAGRPPFRSEELAALLRQIVEEEPPALRGLAPHVDAELATIAHTCLDKDPRRRYAEGQALA